MNYISMQPQPI